MYQENKNKEEIDLSGAFKGSDTSVKSQDKWRRSDQSLYSRTPKIIQWVIKYSGGYVKDEKQANYVLLGFMVVTIVVTILFFVFGGGDTRSPVSPGDLLLTPPSGVIQR